MGKAETLLQEIIDSLRGNQIVKAAWLAGSRGRGTSDELSDIDLWVAIEDDAMSRIALSPLDFVHTVTPTIMHGIAPEIAPNGGAFVGSWVSTDDGFGQVDWYLTPIGSATRAADTLMVFGDVPVAHSKSPGSPDVDSLSKVRDNLILALLMIGNLVKHTRRGNRWRAADHARHVDHCLIKAEILLRDGGEPDFAALQRSLLPEPIPGDTSGFISLSQHLLSLVSNLAERAELYSDLSAAIVALGQTIDQWQSSGWLPTEEYYRRLPRRYMGAGVFITDAEDRVLLVETSYKPNFEIPGGVCDAGEAPSATAVRELEEELGITLPLGRLLVMDHRPQPAPKGDAMMFVYDGGVFENLDDLHPDHKEILRTHLVPLDEIDAFVTASMAMRLRAAYRARTENRLLEIANGTVLA